MRQQYNAKPPKYKKEVAEFINNYKNKHNQLPSQYYFSQFVQNTLSPLYERPYVKIYQYILKFCTGNKSKYPKKYLTRVNGCFDIIENHLQKDLQISK